MADVEDGGDDDEGGEEDAEDGRGEGGEKRRTEGI